MSDDSEVPDKTPDYIEGKWYVLKRMRVRINQKISKDDPLRNSQVAKSLYVSGPFDSREEAEEDAKPREGAVAVCRRGEFGFHR